MNVSVAQRWLVCVRSPCEPVPVCLFITRSGVRLSRPPTHVWILWSRIDSKCGCQPVCVCLCVYPVSVCVYLKWQVVTGSLNSAGSGLTWRTSCEAVWKGWDNFSERSRIVPQLEFCSLLHPLCLLCKHVCPYLPRRGINPDTLSAPPSPFRFKHSDMTRGNSDLGHFFKLILRWGILSRVF